MDINDQYTPHGKEILELARKQADGLNHSFIGTEHLLLALIEHGENTAMQVLKRMGVGSDVLRTSLMRQIGTVPDGIKIIGNISYTPRVKKVLALAEKSAKGLGHQSVGSEHILLGLLWENDGVAAKVLKEAGVDLESAKKIVLEIYQVVIADPGPNVEHAQRSDAATQILPGENFTQIGDLILAALSELHLNSKISAHLRTFLPVISLLSKRGYLFRVAYWVDLVIEMIYPEITDEELRIVVEVLKSHDSSQNEYDVTAQLQRKYNQSTDDSEGLRLGIALQAFTGEPPRRLGPPIDYLAKRKSSAP